jgi:hypothetical protein
MTGSVNGGYVTELEPAMPAPPKGYGWLLELDFRAGEVWGTLWSKELETNWRGKKRLSYRTGKLEFLHEPSSDYRRLNVETATIDEIVASTIRAARTIVRETEEEPNREAALQERMTELETRLGITVRMRRR